MGAHVGEDELAGDRGRVVGDEQQDEVGEVVGRAARVAAAWTAAMASRYSSDMAARMCSVGVVPGATASTRIPDGPSSTAIDLVRWLIAALAAPYTLSIGAERIVSPELTWTITPPRPAATIAPRLGRRAQQRGDEVLVDDRPHVVGVEIDDGTRREPAEHADVVDRDVDAAELIDDTRRPSTRPARGR